MRVVGMVKVRNEAPILQDTLDVWAQWCDQIHVYDDVSTDATAEVAKRHPAVAEVITSTYYDPDRPRAEHYNRQALFTSVQRQVGPSDWYAYFDADEHLVDFDRDLLTRTEAAAIAPHWQDVYITPDSVEVDYRRRPWVDTSDRVIPVFFRVKQAFGYTQPDQRIMHCRGPIARAGTLRHYGLGYSVEQWERKVDYYGREWPEYRKKWEARRGQCIRTNYTSVRGNPLTKVAA